MMICVYASRLEEVEKRLHKIAAKAARYSIPFAYKIGEEHPEPISVYSIDRTTSTRYLVESYTVAAVDITIDCEELIKANGWTVRAKVEHGEHGNIVTAIGNKPAELAWFSAPPRCDHCHTNRVRSVTYFVEHESGEIKQVGRACLKDYTGISPAMAALWAEVQDLSNMGQGCTFDEWSRELVGEQMTETTLVLAHAYDVIKAFGYRKSDMPDSTRFEVDKRVHEGAEPSAEALDQAEKIKAWLLGLEAASRADDATQVDDIERNCFPLVLSGYAKAKHFGRLAYMPLAYQRAAERKAREEQRAREQAQVRASSQYVGEIGQRITVGLAEAVLLTSWEGNYGMTFLYKLMDKKSNVFIWYASRMLDLKEGMTIKATVKAFNERDGVKQTILTRCAICA